MKKLAYLLGLMIAIVPLSQAQNKVPENVTSAFHEKFPQIDKVEWEKENDNEWESEFKMDGKEYSASFKENGQWIETEHEVKKSDIPDDIVALLNKTYTDYKIDEAEMGENQQGKFYEFEIEVGKKEYEVTVDATGKLSSREENEEDEDD